MKVFDSRRLVGRPSTIVALLGAAGVLLVALAVIPMFLLMGSFAAAAGLSGDLYRLFHALMGHYRGGLAMATIGGCGGFGAVCGASIATAATFMRIALPEMPDTLVRQIEAMALEPWAVIFMLLVIYIILGSIFETVSAMIITLPVVFPLIVGLGFDPIWWGVINIMVIEIGQTTPPIGIIPFVLHGMAPDVPLKTIFTGIIPFFVADLVRLAIVATLPILALWLPGKLGMLIG